VPRRGSEARKSIKSRFGFPPAGSAQYDSPLVLLFGFLALIAGSVLLLRVPYLFYQKSRLDHGLEVPAKILHVKSVSVGKGSSLTVEYEFKINGQLIKGDRASIFSKSSGLYFRLREAFDSGKEVICFVDPDDPTFSALEKDVRVIDLFGFIVLGVPFGMIGAWNLVGFFSVPCKRTSEPYRRGSRNP
jgi:hypothetical protein